MTAAPPAATAPGPDALLAALRAGAGGVVDGATVGSAADAPPTAGLGAARASALLAAWTGARLHAGLPGLLVASDGDVALLVGDWCFAHALQALAHAGDLPAIGRLATAIGDCAVLLGPAEAGHLAPRLAEIWAVVAADLAGEQVVGA